MIIFILLLFWFLCGFIQMGISIAYFQKEYSLISEPHYRDDVSFAALLIFTGPIGLFISFFSSGMMKHGWSLNPFKYKWK